MLTEAGRQQLAMLDEAWDELVEQIKVVRGK
jgi:DNA-binding PadR family transcriptional regulator